MDLKYLMQGRTDLTQTDRYIRDYILCHPDAIVRMSARQLAQATFTSQSAVVRFCQRLGYPGFKEFKEDLDPGELNEQSLDFNFPFEEKTPVLDLAKSILSIEVAALRSMAAMLTTQALEQAGELLRKSQVIHLCAIGSSQNLAEEFAFRMKKLGRQVHVISRSIEAHYEFSYADERNCLMLISYSGENSFVHAVTKAAEKKNIPILAITARPESFAASMAEAVLYLPPLESNDEKISTFTSAVCEKAVLDVLYAYQFQEHYEDNVQFVRRDAIRLKTRRKEEE